MTSPAQQPGPRAIRLIFEYEGDQVRLVSQQPVDVAVTGFDLSPERRPGHFVEVRGSADETLSRVRVPTELTASAEVFPERPGEPIVRVDLPEARGAFTVVVPAPEAASHVSLVRIPPATTEHPDLAHRVTNLSRELAAQPTAVEIARFPLRGDQGEAVS
jgi:hypothetical protein